MARMLRKPAGSSSQPSSGWDPVSRRNFAIRMAIYGIGIVAVVIGATIQGRTGHVAAWLSTTLIVLVFTSFILATLCRFILPVRIPRTTGSTMPRLIVIGVIVAILGILSLIGSARH